MLSRVKIQLETQSATNVNGANTAELLESYNFRSKQIQLLSWWHFWKKILIFKIIS